MLTGFIEPTSGTGIVEGLDIRSDMPLIYKLMGVCPQHDLLWEQLSGREHLRFYGRLKGLEGERAVREGEGQAAALYASWACSLQLPVCHDSCAAY
jgi:ABC-type multidrug transport system ATPase subunit